MSTNPSDESAPLQWVENFIILFLGGFGALFAETFRQLATCVFPRRK